MADAHQLARAVALATEAHKGQVDKGGKDYIEHPLRVSAALQGWPAKTAGVLHDIVEDTSVTLEQLRKAGFDATVLAAVDALTKRAGEDYEVYLARLMLQELAVRVKIADMTDNMDLSRIPNPTDKDHRRLEKYRRVLPELQEKLRNYESSSVST